MLQNIDPDFPSSGYNPKSLTVSANARRISRAKKKYLRWLNRKHPDVLKRALERADVTKAQIGLSGLGQNNGEEKAWYDNVLDYVPTALQTWGAYEQQKQLIELNKERAEQGMPPLEEPPATIKVEGEAGPETRQSIERGIQGAMGQYIPFVVGGIALFLLMNRGKRK
jgi:hypothetical protein